MSTLRVNSLRPRTGNTLSVTGQVDFQSGATVTGVVTFSETNLNNNLNITGVVTATSFHGDGSNLSGIDATSLKDSGGSTIVQANSSGIEVTGITTSSGGISIGNVTQTVGVGITVFGGEVNSYVDADNGYTYESRTFFGTGEFVVNTPIITDFIIIAGGGGGGQHQTTNANGGGGAGGVVVGRGVTFPAGSYHVVVGDGGDGYAGGHSTGGVSGGNGYNSSIVCNPVGIAYTGIGGGAGLGDQAHASYNHPARAGGSAGGASRNNAGPNATTQYTYDGTPNLPVTNYNSPTYYNSGRVAGYGNIGGPAAQDYTAGGGGGAGGAGLAGTPPQSPHTGAGGIGITCRYYNGEIEYLAGGGGGGANSSEPSGNGAYGGGRGAGQTPTSPYFVYNNIQLGAPGNYGMDHEDAKPTTGSGGGGNSYWHLQGGGGSGRGGHGAPGRVTIRWRTA